MSCFRGSRWTAAAVVLAALGVSAAADARVKREGTWPEPDKSVTLDVTATPRTEALRKLADAAGWSLVVHAPPGDPVDVHVKQTPASKVLEVLLDDGDYVAWRDGTLVSITRGEGATDALGAMPPVPPVPPTPPAPPPSPAAAPGVAGASSQAVPAPAAASAHADASDDDDDDNDDHHGRGQDRTVMGGNVVIAKGEIARDVTVFGGNLDIEGTASGDVSVFGGNVRVHDGAKIDGDATVFGGTLTLDHGAKVDGDVSTIGGTLHRDPGSHVGGDVSTKGPEGDMEHVPGVIAGIHEAHRSLVARAGGAIMDALRLAAVLFVIGTVLLALTGRRMDMLRAEVATRPMRSLALGLLGAFGSVVVLVALCVTVIGIPIAVVALILFGFGVLGAMCAVLSVVGEALLRHKTENPYVHLAVGCGIFVALGAIPWVGDLVVACTLLAGIGVLVATRAGGLLRKRNGAGAVSVGTAG